MGERDAVRSLRNLYVSAISYNVLTLTDGAIRMCILLFFAELAFSPLSLAIMFSLYECAGVVVNFTGGIVGAHRGLRFMLVTSCVLQGMSCAWLACVLYVFPDLYNAETRNATAITAWVVFGQMLSGAAKDFMKVQGKSVPKLTTKAGDDDVLFKVVAVLTGMKNTLKGVGFFVGSVLVWRFGLEAALASQGVLAVLAVPFALVWMDSDLGISMDPRDRALNWSVFKKDKKVNVLSLARTFLFGARDVWLEIPAPVFLQQVLLWAPFSVGGFFAGYTIIYGQLQAWTSKLYKSNARCSFRRLPDAKDVIAWALAAALHVGLLGCIVLPCYLSLKTGSEAGKVATAVVLMLGFAIFAGIFAANSAVHSYLIVKYSNKDKVSMDLGFYYMSNAGGRLFGTLIGGAVYQYTVEYVGLSACLWISSGMLIVAALISRALREPVSNSLPHIEVPPEPRSVHEQPEASFLLEGNNNVEFIPSYSNAVGEEGKANSHHEDSGETPRVHPEIDASAPGRSKVLTAEMGLALV